MIVSRRGLLLVLATLLCVLTPREAVSPAARPSALPMVSHAMLPPAVLALAAPLPAPLAVHGEAIPTTRYEAGEARRDPAQQVVTPQSIIGAERWRAAGFTGYGVRVAVIDVGFAGYEALLGSALPASVRARSFRADGDLAAGSEHGALAARVVASVAPRAELHLLNFSTQTELAAVIAYLTEERIQVVSFSTAFVFAGPGNGTGAVDDLVGRSAGSGTFWAVSAGNWAQQHWAGAFSDRSGNTVHEFAPGVEEASRFYRAQDLITVALRWDNAWGAACDDYDLELFAPDGALVRASREVQECTGDPVEKIEVLATRDGRYRARVIRVPGAASRRLHLMMLGKPDRGDALDYATPAGSLLEPADHAGVFTVGATSTVNPFQLARFSSRGPTADGRQKPELVAPSGPLPFGDGAFAGTSAATPFVAGAAALLLEAFPSLTPREVGVQLRERAVDIPPTGPDAESGAGVLQLGTLVGLGPLLPPGASTATLTDFTPRDAPLSVFRYRGPPGFPARFAYVLTGTRTPAAFYRLDIARARFDVFVMRAPAFVNTFDVFNDGEFIFVRFR